MNFRRMQFRYGSILSCNVIPMFRRVECKSKRSRTSRTPTAKSSNRIASSKRDKTNQDKLDTHIFDLYIEYVCFPLSPGLISWSSWRIFFTYLLLQICAHRDLWKHIDEDKKSSYAYLDSLWFNSYINASDEKKSKILKWTKSLKIFSRQYVFVPIACW
jgi:hypothetical protein